MTRSRKIGFLIVGLGALPLPLACASLYGVTDLPSDVGDDASPDHAADAHADARTDASRDARADVANDAGLDAHITPPDAHAETSTDAGSQDTGADTGAADTGSDAHHANDAGESHDASDAAAFTLTVTPTPATLPLSGTLVLTATLSSAATAMTPITITALPTGVSIQGTPSIAAGSTSSTVTLAATSGATEGLAMIDVKADGATSTVTLVVAGASGTLDESFDQSGVQNIGSGAATSLAIQSNGDVVVAGTMSGWALVRVNEDGSNDTAFNANVTDTSKGASLPTAGNIAGVVVVPGTNLIALAGYDSTNQNVAVMLYNSDGSRHESFGTAGLFEYGPDNNFHVMTVTGIAVSPTGTLAVVGNTSTGAYALTFANGSSTTHGETTDFASAAVLNAVAYEPSGDLVVGGTTVSGGGQFYLARFTTAALTPVTTFGGDFGPPSGTGNQYLSAAAIATDTDGNVFLVGNESSVDVSPAMVSLSNTGTVAPAAGYAEPLPRPMNGTGYVSVAASPTPGSAIVIANGYDQAGNVALIERITLSGTLDTTFHTTGYSLVNAMDAPTYNAVGIDPYGRIVIVGTDGAGFYITRIWP